MGKKKKAAPPPVGGKLSSSTRLGARELELARDVAKFQGTTLRRVLDEAVRAYAQRVAEEAGRERVPRRRKKKGASNRNLKPGNYARAKKDD